MTHEEDTSNQELGQKRPVIRRDKVVVTKVTEQELSANQGHRRPMRHDTQRFHTCKGTRLQATEKAFQQGTGRFAAACGLPHGLGKLCQRSARIDRQREATTFPAAAHHARMVRESGPCHKPCC